MKDNQNTPFFGWRTPPLAKCSDDLRAPHFQILRSPQSQFELACMLAWWNLAPAECLTKMIDEVQVRHTGQLSACFGVNIDRNKVDFLDSFSQDPERDVRDFLRFAHRPPKKKANEALMWRLLFYWAAIEIDLRRHYHHPIITRTGPAQRVRFCSLPRCYFAACLRALGSDKIQTVFVLNQED